MATSIKAKLRRRPNQEGLFGIVIQVIHNRKPTEISTNQYVAEKYFDKRKGIIKPSHPRADKINYEVQTKKREIEDIVHEFKISSPVFELADIKKVLDGDKLQDPSALTFSKYLSDYINLNPDHLSPTTLSYYSSTLTRWNEKYKNIKLSDIDERILVKFRRRLEGHHKNAVNTVYNRMKTIRKMVHRARRNGLLNHNPFLNISLKQQKGQREYLTMDELAKLTDVGTNTKSEIITKDIFLFSCYTGLRYSDICGLKRSNLYTNGDNKYRLRILLQKTKEPLEFGLNKKAEIIILKYADRCQEYGYIFPMLNKADDSSIKDIKKKIASANAYQNGKLKNLMDKAGVSKKNRSMHCGRHTFAVLSIEKGADLYVLSKVLGHSSISTTEIYAKMIDKRKDELTELWNNE